MSKKLLISILAIALVISVVAGITYVGIAQTETTRLPVSVYSFIKTADITIYLNSDGEAIAINKQGQIIAGPSTNHSYVLQSAINYVYDSGGGKISVLKGTYQLSNYVYLKPNIHIDFGFSTLTKLKYAVFQKDPSITDLENVVIENAILDLEGIPKVVFYGQFFRTVFRNIYAKNIGSDSAVFRITSAINVLFENVHGKTITGATNAILIHLKSTSDTVMVSLVEINSCSMWDDGGSGYLVWATGYGSTGWIQYLNIINSNTIKSTTHIKIEGTVQHINIIGVESDGGIYINDTTGNMKGEINIIGSQFSFAEIDARNALVKFIGGKVGDLTIKSGVIEIDDLDITGQITYTGGIIKQETKGTVVIPAGQTSIYIQHNLITTPSLVLITLNDTVTYSVPFINSTHFEVVLGSQTSTPIKVYWEAKS